MAMKNGPFEDVFPNNGDVPLPCYNVSLPKGSRNNLEINFASFFGIVTGFLMGWNVVSRQKSQVFGKARAVFPWSYC